MDHRIKISLSFPIKLGIFSIDRSRTVGLSFDNYALYLFGEETGLKTTKELDEYVKKNGYFALLLEHSYAAACSYAKHTGGKKPEKVSFVKAMGMLKPEDWKPIQKAFQYSREFGVTERKKKTATR